ncbi:hypothetical protein C4577_02835 [Candidatus Parcubacteria bacterium]|nr:MAG: hypothetical protein C4577_02835 [Candidatus Parcubacteria bacterium]
MRNVTLPKGVYPELDDGEEAVYCGEVAGYDTWAIYNEEESSDPKEKHINRRKKRREKEKNRNW